MTNLKMFSDDTAQGFFDVQCNSGYQLDETIGGRVMCLESGEWSQPLPECTCKFSRRRRPPPLPHPLDSLSLIRSDGLVLHFGIV